MSSLYRDLSDAAFKGKLNKNQLLVFNALVYQTLGFGKTHDPLTDKRLFKLTGVRVDRLRPAIKAVIDKGLFDRKPHKRYQYEYSIGETFLEAHQDDVYTPSIPKKGSPSENENPISGNDKNLTETGQNPPEKATHTITNQTLSNPQQHIQTMTDSQTQQQTTQKNKIDSQQQQTTQKNKINSQQQQTTQKKQIDSQPSQPQSVKLFFAELEHIPNNFAIETSTPTRIEFSIGNDLQPSATTALPAEAETETISNENVTPSAISKTENTENIAKLRKLLALANKKNQPQTETELTNNTDTSLDNIQHHEQPDSEQNERQNIESPQPSQQTETQAIIDTDEANAITFSATPDSDKDDKDDKEEQKPIPLPSAIGKADQRACHNAFRLLNREQQQDVVLAFNYAFKTGTIRNIVGYFINLTRSARDGGLTIPTEALVHTPPSAEKLAADKAADEARKRHHELWSDFTWLRDNAVLQNIDMETLAKQHGAEMEEAYATFAGTQ